MIKMFFMVAGGINLAIAMFLMWCLLEDEVKRFFNIVFRKLKN